jgi:hypothetical protein
MDRREVDHQGDWIGTEASPRGAAVMPTVSHY